MLEFDGQASIFAAVGIATLAAAVLPSALGRLPVSMPMVFVAAGMVGFWLLPDLPDPLPERHPEVALHLTEICVIVSLMGAGLALNRVIGWRRWSSTWRLLGIAMPLTMIAVGLLGGTLLGLSVAGAVLLAAALAPTDPVLASEVQVSEPVTEDGAVDDEVRFALTSEAGLNDGLAFPFTYAAIAISLVGVAPGDWLGGWILVDFFWRLAVGVVAGIAVGWAFGRMFFSSIGERLGLAEKAVGFIALAAVFLAYGVAELAEGYGFIAVFVAAYAIRSTERDHHYHGVLHRFVEQIERLLTVTVLVLLGGAVTRGILADVGWAEIAVAVLFLVVIRPAAGWLALTPGRTGRRERLAIAFFGVRGVGSLFYIAYALQEGDFAEGDRLWAVVVLVVLGSVLLHGVTATPAMTWVDDARAGEARKRGNGEEPEEVPV